jgi:hypothetical protein
MGPRLTRFLPPRHRRARRRRVRAVLRVVPYQLRKHSTYHISGLRTIRILVLYLKFSRISQTQNSAMPPKRKASPPPPGAPTARERKKQKVAAAREIAVQPPPRVRFAGTGSNAVAGPSTAGERSSE